MNMQEMSDQDKIHYSYFYVHLIRKKYEALPREVVDNMLNSICKIGFSGISISFFHHMKPQRVPKNWLVYFMRYEGFTWAQITKIAHVSPNTLHKKLKRNPNFTLKEIHLYLDEHDKANYLKVYQYLHDYKTSLEKRGFTLI
jgi:hypothetical protein